MFTGLCIKQPGAPRTQARQKAWSLFILPFQAWSLSLRSALLYSATSFSSILAATGKVTSRRCGLRPHTFSSNNNNTSSSNNSSSSSRWPAQGLHRAYPSLSAAGGEQRAVWFWGNEAQASWSVERLWAPSQEGITSPSHCNHLRALLRICRHLPKKTCSFRWRNLQGGGHGFPR